MTVSCATCGKMFGDPDDLSTHVDLTHTALAWTKAVVMETLDGGPKTRGIGYFTTGESLRRYAEARKSDDNYVLDPFEFVGPGWYVVSKREHAWADRIAMIPLHDVICSMEACRSRLTMMIQEARRLLSLAEAAQDQKGPNDELG